MKTLMKSQFSTHIITLSTAIIECLKSKQKEAIKLLVQDQMDVVCMLPTGYEKSLIYQLCQ